MKSFKLFIQEATPTVHANLPGAQGGFSSTGTNALGNAGYDKRLFKDPFIDLLSQDYQTQGESGLAKWRFASIWPVSHLTMAGIDDMVNASNKYVDIMDRNTEQRIRSNLSKFYEETDMKKKYDDFIEEAASKRCPEGEYYCTDDKKCKKIPKGKSVGPGGWLRSGHSHHHHGNGNGNGSHNGNGNGNGYSGNGNGGNGNGGGGNGGGE